MKHTIRLWCLLGGVVWMAFAGVSETLAQTTVRGRVSEAASGEPLPSANIVLKELGRGAVSDVNGDYSIANVPPGTYTIESTFVGFRRFSQRITVGTEPLTVNIAFEASRVDLDELVVTGYGVQTKREVTGAIAQVKGEVIENMAVPSFARALQGRAAGVQITGNNGIPGGHQQVRIRGFGSIGASNDPLWIIDGVQVAGVDRARSITSSNTLNALNPNDIESIEVLKDAAAASIYGAQAANGVILITTKKGRSGRPVFSVSAYTGFNEILNKPKLLNGPEWVALRREAAFNSWGPAGTDFVDGLYGPAEDAPTYDWVDAISQKGMLYNLDVSASGGNDATRYYVSGSYNQTDGQFIGTDFNRGVFRVNLDTKLSERLSLESRVNVSNTYQNSSFGPAFNTNNFFISALGQLPVDPIFNEDGTHNLATGSALGANVNPVFFNDVNVNDGVTNQLIGNVAAIVKVADGLVFRSQFGVDWLDAFEKLYHDRRAPAGAAVGIVRRLDTRVMNIQTDQTLNYSKNFRNRHGVTGLLGVNYRHEVLESFTAEGRNVSMPLFKHTLNGTTAFSTTSGFTEWKLASVFGRLGYSYDEKYILSATVRRDGSSRFGANNRYGTFPAISAAWNMSREPFMAKAGFISDLKLRASYGVTGNSSIGDFASLSLFNSTSGHSYSGNPGINFSQLGDAALTWEQSVAKNIGLDLSMWEGRLTLNVDAFIRDTENLLLAEPQPGTSGFASITKNIGSVRNRGLEFALSTYNVATGDFTWVTDFNVAVIRNKVTKLLNPGEDLPGSSLWLGRQLGQVRFVPWAGVNPADGRPMWIDINGNYTYTPTADDLRFTNRSALVPDYYGGLTNTFSYKGLEVTAFLQYQIGLLQFDNQWANLLSDFIYAEIGQSADMLRRWQNPGDITDVPMLREGGTHPGAANSLFPGPGSGRFWKDASYLRLKQLSISYSLPARVTGRLNVRSAKVFAQAVNMWTYTNFDGLEPEIQANAQNFGFYPQPKNYTAGVQFSF